MKRLLSTLAVLAFAAVAAQARFGVHAQGVEQKRDNARLQDAKDTQQNVLSSTVADRDAWQERASWSRAHVQARLCESDPGRRRPSEIGQC